jgi:hypothetical protein
MPRDEPDASTIAPRHDAEAIVLDFVNPIRPGRWSLGGSRQARFDIAESGAGMQTRRSATQSFDHFVQYHVDDLLYVALEKVWVLRGNALYEFGFYHERVSGG